MNAHHNLLKLVGFAFVAVVGSSLAVSACSSNSNNPGPSNVLDSGTQDANSGGDDSSTPGPDGGTPVVDSGSDTGVDAGPACTPDGGATATCNSCAVQGVTDSYNTCSPFGCQGKYDNAMHMVPVPPTPVP
jgi:hypothetical protein